jgi:hypothetical protein
VRQRPDPIGGHLVALRDAPDARVCLGCVLDAGGRVLRWVELWVQDTAGLTADPAYTTLSNRTLDEQWRRRARAMADLNPTLFIRTGWEDTHPTPTWLDPSALRALTPNDADPGTAWQLCRDDAKLTAAALPPYGNSLHRYLFLPERADDSPFVPVTPGAPTSPRTIPAVPATATLIPLNPAGGLMMVCGCEGLPLEDFLDMLAGTSIDPAIAAAGPAAPPIPIPPDPRAAALPAAPAGTSTATPPARPVDPADGWLYLGDHGRCGRMAETFHLKLRALADAVDAVRADLARTRLPLLNLSAESFRVTLGQPGRGLPLLWTGRTALVRPGDAIELPLPGGAARHFLPGRPHTPTVYQPTAAAHPAHGRCVLRLATVTADDSDRAFLEGTFRADATLPALPATLVRLWPTLAGARLDLYARLDRPPSAPLAAGEFRFVTLATPIPTETLTRLRAARGITLADTRFEVLPPCSAACDLHALAVLAVRVLLVDRRTTLAEALVRVLSLCTELAAAPDPVAPLPARIRALFARDPRWLDALGPHRLLYEDVAPADALDLIPPSLWWDALAAVVRMFPGATPDSHCADLGDAPAHAPHAVFTAPAADFRDLLVKSRSLVLTDWKTHREIHAILLARLTGIPADDNEPHAGARP